MRLPRFPNLYMGYGEEPYQWDRPPQRRTPYYDDRSPQEQTYPSQRMMAQYRIIRKLKPGGMSLAINIVEHRSTGKQYIEKQIANHIRGDSSRLEAEIATLRQISIYGGKYNLNAMLQYAPGPRATHLILEYCSGGNLQDKTDELRARNSRHPESFVWHVLLSCSNALDFLHRGPYNMFGRQDPIWDTICHLDIKPENIYLQEIGERHPRVVLGDFGCAVASSDIARGRADLSLAPAFTPGWEAPEMFEANQFGTKTDSWQLGCVVQATCLLSGAPNARALRSGSPCGEWYSRELNSFVTHITATDLKQRQNAEDIMDIAQRNLNRAMLQERARY